MTLSLVVLISGTGSNLAAIIEAIDAGRCDAHIRAVISDRSSAAGLSLASRRGIPTHTVRIKDFDSRASWDAALAETIERYQPDLLVTAGFMRILGAPVLERHSGRVINVHPALLPLFPGTDGPAQAVRAGVRLSGCSVHVVDGGVDSGPILAQAAVPVLPDDSADTLHRRIQVVEHRLLPAVIQAVASGTIQLLPAIRIASGAFAPDAMLVSPALPPV